jgi:hypothetical protein
VWGHSENYASGGSNKIARKVGDSFDHLVSKGHTVLIVWCSWTQSNSARSRKTKEFSLSVWHVSGSFKKQRIPPEESYVISGA